jgi:hypothetical protein
MRLDISPLLYLLTFDTPIIIRRTSDSLWPERHKRLLSLGSEVTYGIKLGENRSFYEWKNIARTENKMVW